MCNSHACVGLCIHGRKLHSRMRACRNRSSARATFLPFSTRRDIPATEDLLYHLRRINWRARTPMRKGRQAFAKEHKILTAMFVSKITLSIMVGYVFRSRRRYLSRRIKRVRSFVAALMSVDRWLALRMMRRPLTIVVSIVSRACSAGQWAVQETLRARFECGEFAYA